MRTLNRNERLLAIAFGAILFLILNFMGMGWVADQVRTGHATISGLETDVAATRKILEQRPYWMARQVWMKAHPPEVYDPINSQSKFVQDVQASVQAHGLKIQLQQPLETQRVGQLSVAKIDLTIDGRLESIVRWLDSVQQPGKYTLTEKFELKQADEGNTMELQVLLGKVYSSGAVAASP